MLTYLLPDLSKGQECRIWLFALQYHTLEPLRWFSGACSRPGSLILMQTQKGLDGCLPLESFGGSVVKCSQCYAVGPWARYLPTLFFGFLLCKRKLKLIPTSWDLTR